MLTYDVSGARPRRVGIGRETGPPSHQGQVGRPSRRCECLNQALMRSRVVADGTLDVCFRPIPLAPSWLWSMLPAVELGPVDAGVFTDDLIFDVAVRSAEILQDLFARAAVRDHVGRVRLQPPGDGVAQPGLALAQAQYPPLVAER